MAYGVIGNTTGFGPVILGSSPSRPTSEIPVYLGIFANVQSLAKQGCLLYICTNERIIVFMRGLRVPSFITETLFVQALAKHKK